MTEEQITRLYGPRCAEHCDDCCVCEVWAMADHIEKLEADNARLREALDYIADCDLSGADDEAIVVMAPVFIKIARAALQGTKP